MGAEVELTKNYPGNFPADDAAVDWRQLHLLLFYAILAIHWSHLEPLYNLTHLHAGQCMQHASVFLDCRTLRPEAIARLGCTWNANLPVLGRYYRRLCGLQSYASRPVRSGGEYCRQYLCRQCTDRFHRNLYLLFRLDLGPRCVDRYRRDLPSTYPLAWRWPVNCK